MVLLEEGLWRPKKLNTPEFMGPSKNRKGRVREFVCVKGEGGGHAAGPTSEISADWCRPKRWIIERRRWRKEGAYGRWMTSPGGYWEMGRVKTCEYGLCARFEMWRHSGHARHSRNRGLCSSDPRLQVAVALHARTRTHTQILFKASLLLHISA